MRILYLGLPLGACCLARAGHDLAVIALGHPDAPGARRVRRTSRGLVLGRPDLDHPDIERAIASARPDVLLSWFWPRRVPEAILALVGGRAFGVHPSLLPRHRGRDPYFWAILAGDRETGVTLHRLARDYDTGNVIAQRRLAIDAHENAWTLAKRLDRPSLALLRECADRLRAGETLEGSPQEPALATDAPRPTDEDLALRFDRSASELARLVRAAAPTPGACMELEGALVVVTEARVYEGSLPRVLAVGEAMQTSEGLAVRCGEGALLITAYEE